MIWARNAYDVNYINQQKMEGCSELTQVLIKNNTNLVETKQVNLAFLVRFVDFLVL